MRRWLKKILQGLAYVAAALVILLAIAVGIFRLTLPRLPEYQADIKEWASEALRMDVEFASMNARWRLSGPELTFFNASLGDQSAAVEIIAAEEVAIGVGLLRLISDRELVVDRVTIRGTTIDIRADGDGDWIIQGIPYDELPLEPSMETATSATLEFVGRDIAVVYEHPPSGQLLQFNAETINVGKSADEITLDAEIELPQAFGGALEVSASNRLGETGAGPWQVYMEATSVDLSGLSRVQPIRLPVIQSGEADLIAWFDFYAGAVSRATTNAVVRDFRTEDSARLGAVEFQGSIEYSAEPDGWLLGLNQLRVDTRNGGWPLSSLQVRVQKDVDGNLTGLRAGASYLNLADADYVSPWLPVDLRSQVAEFAPSGVVTDFSLELTGLQTDQPGFDLLMDMEDAGIAAVDEWPGVRQFSGRLRANRNGGRIEIESTDLVVDVGDNLPEELRLEDAIGTIIWRRNDTSTIVLSDSIQVRNTDFDSQMSFQVSVPADGTSPMVDYDSTWSVYDVSAARRYLPVTLIRPRLYQWLSTALVSGYVRRGTTQLNGPLDSFPFDDGSGIFRIEARLEDTVLNFSPNWPDPEFQHLDIVVENARLYSENNAAVNVGNVVENARIEIQDLRQPILTIDTFATGSLQTIKDYVTQSPISAMFGGQLDRVDVAGDASFDLSIDLPIQRPQEYEFTTRIRASDGQVAVRGFDAPITGLNGAVTITRQTIAAESLFGTFLGYPVDLSLSRNTNPDAPHNVVLEGRGSTTTNDIASQFDLDFGDVVGGSLDYVATVSFPNARADQRGPLRVVVESGLQGIQTDLPEPFAKGASQVRNLSTSIEFPDPERISLSGSIAGDINWTGEFVREDNAWDFDRGVLAVGEYPRPAETRGLHIQGQLDSLDLHAWLAEGRRGNEEVGFGERIRSIDLGIDRLYAIGQTYTDQRLEVNRSGLDWAIRVSGENAAGNISVPYDFESSRPISLNMTRLVLPGRDNADMATRDITIDPRALPALSVRVADFALGERQFGELEADFEKTARGLETSVLRTRDESFTVEGEAGWVVGLDGERTFIDVTLESSNVQATWERLAYDPGIVSNAMQLGLNLGWDGGPRPDFMSALSGDVSVRIAAGQLSDVNPGAGRVFGLMSFTALPRRLSLDFSDVFDRGFGFDEIIGDFRLSAGDAFTCNLTMTGPAADVGIVGRAGLASRNYDQAAVVSANVGGTLPIAGFFLGGPQVAAALLVFSQVFKKPLEEIGQVFYTVAGSWDDPAIANADSQVFADVSGRAGCIDAQ